MREDYIKLKELNEEVYSKLSRLHNDQVFNIYQLRLQYSYALDWHLAKIGGIL